nr:hypothetical protein [Candidatus Frankia alpina]
MTRAGRWTVGEEEFAGLFADAAAGLAARTFRYAIGRERLAGRLANAVRVRAEAGGHFPTDGAVRTLARSRAVRDAVEAAWPKADAAGLVRRLLTARRCSPAPPTASSTPTSSGCCWPRHRPAGPARPAGRPPTCSASTRRRTSPRCSAGRWRAAAPTAP